MLELPGVTLVCIDCVQHELALAAIEQTLMRCRFGEALFVTDREIAIEELRVVQVPPIRAYADYSQFVAKDLVELIRTPHALIIQWDAFVVNPSAWSEEFLAFDHVAAMPRAGGGDRPSSAGGISLFSQRLLNALRDPRVTGIENEDTAIRQTYRPLLEGTFGLRYAQKAIAERFAFGAGYPVGQPFGFQGLFNMWMFFQPQDLNAFLAMASPAILGSAAALSLGVNLRDLGRSDEAKAVLRAILGAHPGNAVARTVLDAMQRAAAPAAQPARTAVGRNDPCPCGSGQKFKQCHGRLVGAPALPEAAAVVTEPAVDADSLVADGDLAVLFHRARAALDRNDLAAAETMYRKVLERQPDDPVATEYLGVIATKLRRFDEAEPLLLRAIEISPDAPEYHNNLGLLNQVRAQFAAAAAAYRQALKLAPEYATAHNNLGLALQEQGLVAEAILSFRAAVRYLPEFAEAHWNLALALLLTGELEEGFVEQEWRLKVAQRRDWWARRRQFPEWNGEPLTAKRLLILAEQGMGDMIQFMRYAEDLVARGATVLVEAPPELTDLLREAPGVAAVVPRDGPYPQCDYQAPIMSLPLRCGTRLETIPARAQYLAADASCVARWRELLGEKKKPRVGLAWAGNPDHVRDAFRSMPLAALTPLLALQGIEWISLQKGAAAAQMATLPPECALRDMGRDSRNFADLAALISELDLVITVDTAVVHLAGALGRPTLLLLDTGHDWRWLRNRNDSPWYPTVRLIRQVVRGDWASAIALTRIELYRHLDL
jgi:tetratricopeptide (TPR) repeat protein